MDISLPEDTQFDWDEGNINKNRLKHNVTKEECEDVFFTNPQIITQDEKHSHTEIRYSLLGQTRERRFLTVIFTIRKDKIRVISTRDQNKKEKLLFKKDLEVEKI